MGHGAVGFAVVGEDEGAGELAGGGVGEVEEGGDVAHGVKAGEGVLEVLVSEGGGVERVGVG